MGEAACDARLMTFLTCVQAVRDQTPGGFAAVKLTALGDPVLLSQISTCAHVRCFECRVWKSLRNRRADLPVDRFFNARLLHGEKSTIEDGENHEIAGDAPPERFSRGILKAGSGTKLVNLQQSTLLVLRIVLRSKMLFLPSERFWCSAFFFYPMRFRFFDNSWYESCSRTSTATATVS